MDANKAPFDVQSERRQFIDTERCTYSQVIIGFIEEHFTEKEFFTNFDCPDGIIDRLDLVPDSPKRVTMNTPQLDSPAECPTKLAQSQSAPVGPADDRLTAVVSKLQAIEGKIDSLNKKVVDTAESQTVDLKNRLSKLEECVEHNTTQVQGYSKIMAMILQRDIAKVLETVGQSGRFKGHKCHWISCQH